MRENDVFDCRKRELQAAARQTAAAHDKNEEASSRAYLVGAELESHTIVFENHNDFQRVLHILRLEICVLVNRFNIVTCSVRVSKHRIAHMKALVKTHLVSLVSGRNTQVAKNQFLGQPTHAQQPMPLAVSDLVSVAFQPQIVE